jgi:hypothetical protein
MTTSTDARIQPRCGRPKKSGDPCRTPTAHEGLACGRHRAPAPSADTPAQNLVAAFVESYQCPACDAEVELFTAGPLQLLVVGHNGSCPQLAERVKQRSAS